jgi:hypothetical protein
MAVFPRAIIFGGLLSGAAACGLFSSHHHRSAAVDPTDRRQVGVAVESHNWSDITVYLVSGGMLQRLGMVTALSSGTFEFSSHRLNTSGDVRLRALPVAGRPFTSESILVQPGQVITWVLESDLNRSSVSVY